MICVHSWADDKAQMRQRALYWRAATHPKHAPQTPPHSRSRQPHQTPGQRLAADAEIFRKLAHPLPTSLRDTQNYVRAFTEGRSIAE